MTRIYFNDVVTRDGFQIEPNFIPTDDKVKLVDELSQCGFAKIEVTSFTSPKAIPMLRDAEEVMGRIQRQVLSTRSWYPIYAGQSVPLNLAQMNSIWSCRPLRLITWLTYA